MGGIFQRNNVFSWFYFFPNSFRFIGNLSDNTESFHISHHTQHTVSLVINISYQCSIFVTIDERILMCYC